MLDFTYKDLFWKTFNSLCKNLPPVDCNKCFFFELTSPFNKIVVRHTVASLTLLGGRDTETLQELSLEEASSFFECISVVKSFKLSSINDCIAAFDTFNGIDQEGFVVVDAAFNRLKIKHPQYIGLHHLKSGLNSKRSIVEVVRNGEVEEVIASLPEFSDMLLEAKDRFERLVSDLEGSYEKHKHIENQKEFAIAIKTVKCPPALFTLRRNNVSIRKFLQNINIDSVMSLLGYTTK